MLDEQTLAERLRETAEQQDDLLPAGLDADLAAGRRRLRRNRLAIGGSALAALLVIGGVTATVTALDDPAGGTQAPVAGGDDPTRPEYTDTPSVKPPAGKGQQRPDTDELMQRTAAFRAILRAVAVDHLDPSKQHLDFSSNSFSGGGGGGDRNWGTKLGWKIKGQRGQGMVFLSLANKAQPAHENPCGQWFDEPVACRPVKLPNGRDAEIAREGENLEVRYVQPDGEQMTVEIHSLFGNNTTIPVHDLGISQQQVLDLVQDSRLDLPPLTIEEQAEKAENDAFAKLSARQLFNPAAKRLDPSGGHLWFGHLDNKDQVVMRAQWRTPGSNARDYIWVGVEMHRLATPCGNQTNTVCHRVTLPNGRPAMVGVNPKRGAIEATYEQPDGDSVWVAIDPQRGHTAASLGITQQQVLELVADPALDK